MDINSLLSPSDTPTSETPPPTHHSSTSSPAPASSPNRQQRPGKLTKRNSSALSQQVLLSSHNQSPLPSPQDQLLTPSSHRGDGALHTFPQMSLNSPGYPSVTSGARVSSAQNSPLMGERGGQSPMMRQASTPGMDTLADLAALQQHQSVARNSPGGHRQPSISLGNLPRQLSTTSAKDLVMADRSPKLPRTFSARALAPQDAQTLSTLSQQLTDKPLDYSAHLQYIALLRKGLVAHIEQGQPAHTYELLNDLNAARQNMDMVYTMSEDLWVEWLSDCRRTVQEKAQSGSAEDRVNERIKLTELFNKCLSEESNSARLWRMYGDYMFELWASTSQAEGGQAWAEEDRQIRKDVFTWDAMLNVWKQGVEATQWQISGSEIVWDRYVDILLEEQSERKNAELKTTVENTFAARLMRPHTTWDDTSKKYSTFISKHYSSQYEVIMKTANEKAGQAKKQYQMREPFEFQIQLAAQKGDKDAEWAAYQSYLDWELKHQGVFSFEFIVGLYQRVTTRFSTDASVWEDYIEYLIQQKDQRVSTLDVAERATRHCPWSGDLWSHRLLTLEAEQKAFQELEVVKHRATKTGMLDHGGMEELLKVYVTWCGFLRRKAFENPGASEDDMDTAEMGIHTALEHVKQIGVKKYGKDFTGDPLYRLERIHIKFFLQCGKIEAARNAWEDLVKQQANSYDFWYRYYIFEMVLWSKFSTPDTRNQQIRPPRECTTLLRRALQYVQTMDWPEQLIQMFLNHCEQHESVSELRIAFIETRRAKADVARRRKREADEAAAVTAQQQQQHQDSGYGQAPMEDVQNSSKRKREGDFADAGQTSKRTKANDEAESIHQSTETNTVPTNTQEPKRDRENAVVFVQNLPSSVTEIKLRQFFRECGKIVAVSLKESKDTLLATVEFEKPDEAEYALIKGARPFDGNEIQVTSAAGTTLYVTNYPPEADEGTLREIFEPCGQIVDMRFPSLQANTHRRFCFIQFLTHEEALVAAESLHNFPFDETHTMSVKLSEPEKKKERTGAIYEGREVIIKNISFESTAKDIQQLAETYGEIETAPRMPKRVDGKHKGTAFIVYKTADDAQAAAAALNSKPFQGRDLSVQVADPNFKAGKKGIQTTVIGSATPEPSANGERHGSAQPDYRQRTLVLLNIPDTVNDARIRSLAEKYGPLNKIQMHYEHQGALIEFANMADVGKASLALDGYEISPGRKLRMGTYAELKSTKAEFRSDKLMNKKKMQQANKKENGSGVKNGGDATLKLLAGRSSRPLQARRGGKGGLGFKGKAAPGAAAPVVKSADAEKDEGAEGKKSNADFKAMFLAGGGKKTDGDAMQE